MVFPLVKWLKWLINYQCLCCLMFRHIYQTYIKSCSYIRLLTWILSSYLSFAFRLISRTPTSAALEQQTDKCKQKFNVTKKKKKIHTLNHSADTFDMSCRDAQLLLATVFWKNVFVPRMVFRQCGRSNTAKLHLI